MGFAFAKAARLLEAELSGGVNGLPDGIQSPLTLNRPTVHQPDVQTDSLDPAAPGGPSPLNSGMGPYGTPVASDPLMTDPIRPGQAIPHVTGADMDTTVLR